MWEAPRLGARWGLRFVGAGDESAGARDPLKLVCSRISKWKDELITPEEAPAAAEALIAGANEFGPPVDPPSLRAAACVYLAYQRTLRDANAADFGDLLLWPVRAMMADHAYRSRWAGRFECVLADEYQDANRAQYLAASALDRASRDLRCR